MRDITMFRSSKITQRFVLSMELMNEMYLINNICFLSNPMPNGPDFYIPQIQTDQGQMNILSWSKSTNDILMFNFIPLW